MKIKIGGIDYTVKFIDPVQSPLLDEDSSAWGKVSLTDAVIYIDNRLSDPVVDQTLIHELIHIGFEDAGVLNHDEPLIIRLTAFFHALFIDNPDLFGFNFSNRTKKDNGNL